MLFSISDTSVLALPPTPAVYFLLISLPLLVFSESVSFRAGHAIFKILCSTAFASGPLLVGTEWSPYHHLITTGLTLSFIGDICLIPSRKEYYDSSSKSVEATRATRKGAASSNDTGEVEISTSFKLGILAFAGAHIAYILAFLQNSSELSWPSLFTTFAASMAAGKWLGAIYPARNLSPWSNLLDLSISGEMRPLVFMYATIISSMLAVSVATNAPASSVTWSHQRVVGAGMFVISDLFVATDAFGNSSAASKGIKKAAVRRHSVLKNAVGWGLYFWGQMILAGTVYA